MVMQIKLIVVVVHLLPLFIFNRSSGEKLIEYQAHCEIMSVILMTILFYRALILQGEI